MLFAAPRASADVYDDNPAAASRGPGDMWLFARAGDGATLERHWTGSAWSDWSSLGGVSTSGPAAAAYNGQVHVFIRGTDGAVYTNYLSGSRLERLGVARRLRDVGARGGAAARAAELPRPRGPRQRQHDRLPQLRARQRLVAVGVARRQPHVGTGAGVAGRRHRQRVGARDRRRGVPEVVDRVGMDRVGLARGRDLRRAGSDLAGSGLHQPLRARQRQPVVRRFVERRLVGLAGAGPDADRLHAGAVQRRPVARGRGRPPRSGPAAEVVVGRAVAGARGPTSGRWRSRSR